MTDEETAAQIKLLRNEIKELHSHMSQVSGARGPGGNHGWLKYLVKDLETNPHTQYKVHLYGAIYWLVNFPAITLLYLFAPNLWLKLGIFITLIYSIYANFATDYGSMSAAMASFGASPALPEIPGEPPHE